MPPFRVALRLVLTFRSPRSHRRDTFSRTSESYGHQQIHDSSAAFDLKPLNPIFQRVSQGLQIGGTRGSANVQIGRHRRPFLLIQVADFARLPASAFNLPSNPLSDGSRGLAIGATSPATSGAGLTFAKPMARASIANVKSRAPPDLIFASGPLIPTFANVPARVVCQCWNRTTR